MPDTDGNDQHPKNHGNLIDLGVVEVEQEADERRDGIDRDRGAEHERPEGSKAGDGEPDRSPRT